MTTGAGSCSPLSATTRTSAPRTFGRNVACGVASSDMPEQRARLAISTSGKPAARLLAERRPDRTRHGGDARIMCEAEVWLAGLCPLRPLERGAVPAAQPCRRDVGALEELEERRVGVG
jgi:hypothetical protein